MVWRPELIRNDNGEELVYKRPVVVEKLKWRRCEEKLGYERRSPRPLPKDICGKSARCLVRARVADKAADAVPIDALEVRAGRQVPALLLPEGVFVLEVEDPLGKLISTHRVKMTKPASKGDPS